MANRYHTEFSDRKITSPVPAKFAAVRAMPTYPDKTRSWVTNIGPSGPKRNTTGVAVVKNSAKKHMADGEGKMTKRKK